MNLEQLNASNYFLEYVKKESPEIWSALKRAEGLGLVHIDEENDAVTATNRLLLTYPDLHEVINFLTETWHQKQAENMGKAIISSLSGADRK